MFVKTEEYSGIKHSTSCFNYNRFPKWAFSGITYIIHGWSNKSNYEIDMVNCINEEETAFYTFESMYFCFINPEHNMLICRTYNVTSRNSPQNQLNSKTLFSKELGKNMVLFFTCSMEVPSSSFWSLGKLYLTLYLMHHLCAGANV